VNDMAIENNEKTFKWVGLMVSNGHDESSIISSSDDQDEGAKMIPLAWKIAEQKIKTKNTGTVIVKEFHGNDEVETWTEVLFNVSIDCNA